MSRACGARSADRAAAPLPFPGGKTRWSAERIARLGFLIGQGWPADRIARDPLIAAHANNVHRQAQRFGLSLLEARVAHDPAGSKVRAVFDAAAAKRNLTREGLIKLLLATIGEEPDLIGNIIDDGA